MDYRKIVEDIKKREAEVTPSSVAAVMTVELQLFLGLLLALFLLARMVSPAAAVVVMIPVTLLSMRLFYSKTAFRENDDRFNTLLFYAILALVSIIVLVGWRP